MKVTAMVGDGHSKVMTKCDGGIVRKAPGRPRTIKKSRKTAFTNGWFMICDPKTGKVVTVVQQVNPENNNDVERAFDKAIDKHKHTDCLVYDI